MSSAEDYDHLRHLLDKLRPEQLRHLRAVADTDPELKPQEGAEELPPAIERPGFLAFVGMGDSGRTDTAERHRELITEWIDEGRIR
ncbi:hypothetical protein [Streptomyces luteolus]|uniref:Uncharacterized protein n=1 Tax=Streptomyces luteolus TaxID=3043615 RepID=A0ABT6T243_9ACTN|nr:hypothetical protein [Streptomyces sp. B-S-A12]MDI3421938.1 hypothetical protein [Streptomyces sp. B-S-A12]